MRMIVARIQDALNIWDSAPQPGPKWCWLRVKASICIAFGWEHVDAVGGYDQHVPIWASSQGVRWTCDGPECHWHEIAVAHSWRKWTFTSYVNGY
jgi:hypothetical protein